MNRRVLDLLGLSFRVTANRSIVPNHQIKTVLANGMITIYFPSFTYRISCKVPKIYHVGLTRKSAGRSFLNDFMKNNFEKQTAIFNPSITRLIDKVFFLSHCSSFSL